MTEPRDKETDSRPDDEAAEETAAPEQAAEEQVGEPRIDDDQVEAESAEPVELSAEEILRNERDSFEQKWLRVVAELDNVRKRSRREILETRRFSQAEILRSLLEVQDNFERALQSAGDSSDTGEAEAFREGVELIFQKFRAILKDKGVQPMEALGVEFDPTFHEAVGQLPREDTESGQVIEVIQQGFHFGDMVLRPAKVIISS
ncbi:MAG: nucleotide exchange factor GrpE [Candidatus Krumholzibacteriota bacterium]